MRQPAFSEFYSVWSALKRLTVGWVVIATALLLLLSAQSFGAAKSVPEWMKKRIALREFYCEAEFRLFYTFEGESALSPAQRSDADQNGVPDIIQNFARQLIIARRLYVDVFQLRHPFESPRYKNRVKCFDVHVAKMPLETGGGRTGSAGDAAVCYPRGLDALKDCQALTIDLSKDLACDNPTPAHELFHQFQNGYTQFKNAWYTEGTARWWEYALRKGVGKSGAMPVTDADQKALFAAKYDAGGFWNALAAACDPAGTFSLPADLEAIRYVGSDQRVVEDDRLHGIAFMKALLEELDAADDEVSKSEGLDPLNWKEARQRAVENNGPIWTATQNVFRRFSPNSLPK